MSDPATCLVCNELLPVDGALLFCVECGFSYHLGSCSGVAESTFKSKGDSFKESWRCSTCRKSKTRGGHGSQKQKQDPEITAQLAEINRKLASLLPLREKVDTLLSVKETVVKIEQSMQHLSDKYDEILANVEKNGKEICDLRNRIGTLEASNSAAELKHLRNEVNNLDQYGRRQNLEIHGLPASHGENLLDMVNELAGKLSIPQLTVSEIDAIHRLPSKTDQTPPVILRFMSRTTRDAWLAKKAYLRESRSEIKLQENMTPQNKKLLWLARTKAAEMQYRFTWFKNGKILVRKAAGDRAIRILNEDDLSKIR